MPRFLIQLTHADEHGACVRALEALERSGSHYVTHADWGCRDGIHRGWLIADVDDRDEAMRIVPPELRYDASIIQLNRFTREEIRTLIADLESAPAATGTGS